MLKVLRPGLLTTIQDAGRFGWYHIGMPPSGAMDQFSFRAGNLLAGNDEGAAALETTFLGPGPRGRRRRDGRGDRRAARTAAQRRARADVGRARA